MKKIMLLVSVFVCCFAKTCIGAARDVGSKPQQVVRDRTQPTEQERRRAEQQAQILRGNQRPLGQIITVRWRAGVRVDGY